MFQIYHEISLNAIATLSSASELKNSSLFEYYSNDDDGAAIFGAEFASLDEKVGLVDPDKKLHIETIH